jgi:hypothetical protein
VLEYLLSSCYPDSAKAFAEEVNSRREEDEDNDPEDQTVEDNGMEGVEASPPPESWASGGKLDGNIKVSAGDGEDGTGVEGVLSRRSLQDARLRQSMSIISRFFQRSSAHAPFRFHS